MSGYIHSDSVTHGRNAEYVTPRDNKYIRCWNCGFMCNSDRDMSSSKGSTVGDGVTTPATLLDGAVLAGAIAITVDATTGFATPETGSITAFASGGRKRTTVTSASHGLKGGKVVITSTTNYNGTFYIDNIFTNTFDIHIAFVADDATGTWTVPHYIYIHDTGSATSAPRVDKVLYTAIASSTSFTTATGTVLAHDDNMYVKGETTYAGCPFCGCLHYKRR